ncbi:hypothetical protein ATER59S_05155 [Aquamicrobium terrae]
MLMQAPGAARKSKGRGFRRTLGKPFSVAPVRRDKNYFIVGMANSAPSLTPDGQREVTVLVLV